MNISIANRLYEYRKKSGLSQEELAAKLGVSRQAVSKWERAEASPDTDNLINLSKLYGVTLDDLINKDPIINAQSEDSDTADAEEGNDAATDDNTESAPEDDSDRDDDDDDDDGDDDDEDAKVDEKSDKNVHIGFDGIHVRDGDEEVHISWHGIKAKGGDGESVNIGKDGFAIIDKDGNVKAGKSKHWLLHELPVPTIIAIIYLVLGFAWNLWHPGWIIFMLIPVFYSAFTAIEQHDPSCFCYPVLISAMYLLIGCVWNGWHPWWVLFLTIPIYYSLCDIWKKYKR